MYTSFLNNTAQSKQMGCSKGFRNRNQVVEPPSKESLHMGLASNQLLKVSQRVLDGKAYVKYKINDTCFVIFHEDFRREFIIKAIPDSEDISKWIQLQTHSNIITAFDTFYETVSGCKFSMVENNNDSNIFNHIKSLGLDLAIDVPRSYIEKIYDVTIQLATGLDFAHNAGLVHGQFDLSKVLIEKENDNFLFKITDFSPQTSMDLPISTEANYWPFSKQKTQISDREKLEVIMLKDIYTLGISILELMIGRTSKQSFSISLDSLPLTWAEFPESTPLIQVLSQCIQIDSITQRKGRLQSIRKLLIREYKKFFNKPFYKMEHPYVGKKADVFNKQGIVALFRGEEGKALGYWSEAKLISDRHFDSQANYCMHRWSTGKISDSQLMSELGNFVFGVPGKGKTIEAYLKIATGEREAGMQILKEYIATTKEGLTGQARLQNLKLQKQLADAEEVHTEVQMNKGLFPQNGSVTHNHKRQIKHISFAQNSCYMTTICESETRVWKVKDSVMGCVVTSLQKENAREAQSFDQVSKPVAAVMNNGNRFVVHRGNMRLHLYEVIEIGQERQTRFIETIDLVKEIQGSGNEEFQFDVQNGDELMDLRYIDNGEEAETHLRVYLQVQEQHYFADVNLADGATTLKEAKYFQDMSVFNVKDEGEEGEEDSQMQGRQEVLANLIEEQLSQGNWLYFPARDKRLVVVAVVENPEEKHYMIYDLQRASYIRKIEKKLMSDDAVAINSSGTILVFVEDDSIRVRTVRVPNSAILVQRLRPRFAVAETKMNPAQASNNRQQFKDKIYRELHTYHMFKEDPLVEKQLGITEEQNVQLMVLRYEEAVLAHYKLKANREFMMLQKVLLRDSAKTAAMKDLQQNCPLVGVEGLKRIEVYDDELTFVSKNSTIDFVQMSSEPHRNFFLIAMQGIIYKYDLVTKELLFQFKTDVRNSMHLYDKDDKLVVTNDEEIRLWDFDDHKEEAPTLLTMKQSSLKVEKVFINKNCPGDLHVCVTCQDEFNVYVHLKQEINQERNLTQKMYCHKMQAKFQGHLDERDGVVTACAFTKASDKLIIGTSLGKLIEYDIETGQREENDKQVAGVEQAITKIISLQAIEDNEAFILLVDDEQIFIYNHSKKADPKEVDFGDDGQEFSGKKICNIQVSSNNKFFMIGIPSERALGWFGLNRVHFTVRALKWITKFKFQTFFADDHLSSIMLLDDNHKQLDFQIVLWRFDTKKLDMSTLRTLDVGLEQLNNEDNEDVDSLDSDGNEKQEPRQVEKIQGSSCCTIF